MFLPLVAGRSHLFNSLYKSKEVKLSDGGEEKNYERKTEGKINWFLDSAWALAGIVSVESKTEDNLILIESFRFFLGEFNCLRFLHIRLLRSVPS